MGSEFYQKSICYFTLQLRQDLTFSFPSYKQNIFANHSLHFQFGKCPLGKDAFSNQLISLDSSLYLGLACISLLSFNSSVILTERFYLFFSIFGYF